MKQKRIDNLITIVLFNAVLILLFSYIYYTMSNELEVLDDRTIKDKI